jgi:phosphotransferase system HPr-like phosphotransfer protein
VVPNSLVAGFAPFHAALSVGIAGLSPTTATAAFNEVRSLPDWNRIPDQRPQQLTDLLDRRRSLALWISPTLGATVCTLLGLEPRDVYQREVRPDRFLPAYRELALTLTQRIHASPATRIIHTLEAHPQVRLSLLRGSSTQPTPLSTSIIQWLLLGLKAGEKITLRAEGPDGARVLRALEEENERGWIFEESPRRPPSVRKIISKDPRALAQEIVSVMRSLDEYALSGIYHLASGELHVGSPSIAHTMIAVHAGFEDQSSYTRINFELIGDRLSLTFPETEVFQVEAITGRHLLKKWLGDLFGR